MRSVKIVIIIDTGAFFAVLCFKWSVKKYWVAKILLALWDAFLHEKNCNYNLWKFCYKSAILQRHAEFNSFYDEIFFIVSWGDYVKKKQSVRAHVQDGSSKTSFILSFSKWCRKSTLYCKWKKFVLLYWQLVNQGIFTYTKKY